jgi:transposase-like protein
MALSKSALSELLDALRAGGDLDLVREALALVLQALIEAEATQHIGARPYERSEQRTAHRNGSRSRLLSTKAGDVELRIPKLAMRCVKRRLGPVSGHRGVAAQRVRAEPTTGRARTA